MILKNAIRSHLKLFLKCGFVNGPEKLKGDSIWLSIRLHRNLSSLSSSDDFSWPNQSLLSSQHELSKYVHVAIHFFRVSTRKSEKKTWFHFSQIFWSSTSYAGLHCYETASMKPDFFSILTRCACNFTVAFHTKVIKLKYDHLVDLIKNCTWCCGLI